jgi:N-acetylneuraminate synthase/N,N'-diacetyllegionaminate synthase
MAKIKIGNKLIGAGEPCFIIAEAGSNHNGSLEQAKKLIDVAVASKADAVKFQIYKAESLYSRYTPEFSYLKGQNVYELIKSIETPREWLKELAGYCEDRNIARKGKPMIISTGMANLCEIEDAITAIKSVGTEDILLLHCNSLYPTPVEAVNLKAMETMRTAFKVPIGFSDHTLGIHIPVAAVAMGACD